MVSTYYWILLFHHITVSLHTIFKCFISNVYYSTKTAVKSHTPFYISNKNYEFKCCLLLRWCCYQHFYQNCSKLAFLIYLIFEWSLHLTCLSLSCAMLPNVINVALPLLFFHLEIKIELAT